MSLTTDKQRHSGIIQQHTIDFFTLAKKMSKFSIKYYKMTTLAIRKKLADYMQVADDKKVKAMYALFEDDIEQEMLEYTGALKKQLDAGQAYYKNGGKMISAAAADKEIKKLLQTARKK
jgi:hypothetical protein